MQKVKQSVKQKDNFRKPSTQTNANLALKNGASEESRTLDRRFTKPLLCHWATLAFEFIIGQNTTPQQPGGKQSGKHFLRSWTLTMCYLTQVTVGYSNILCYFS